MKSIWELWVEFSREVVGAMADELNPEQREPFLNAMRMAFMGGVSQMLAGISRAGADEQAAGGVPR